MNLRRHRRTVIPVHSEQLACDCVWLKRAAFTALRRGMVDKEGVVVSAPYFPNQQPAECGHFYPNVLRLRDERKPDGTLVRIIDCSTCGRYELVLDERQLGKDLLSKLKKTGSDVAISDHEVAEIRQKRLDDILSVTRKAAGRTLQSIIETAIKQGADAVELEYRSGGGLEVSYMCGNTGLGEVIDDRESIRAIISELITQAKLEHRSRGLFKHIHADMDYEIRAEQYESFGESAFRLSLRKPKQRA